MKQGFIATLTAITIIISSSFAATPPPMNPFASASKLPLEAPVFDKIKESDYMPAFVEAIKQQQDEISIIANNPAAPTFANTIGAMEKSGRMLERVSEVFFALVQANTNPALDKIQSEVTPLLAEHHDKIFLDPNLFARVKKLYAERDQLNLDPESAQLLKIYYLQFIHAGANLNAADKSRLQNINKKLAELETTFQQKLIAANNAGALTLSDQTDLAGLSNNEIAAYTVNNNYVIPLQNTTQQPLLASLIQRNIRENYLINLGVEPKNVMSMIHGLQLFPSQNCARKKQLF